MKKIKILGILVTMLIVLYIILFKMCNIQDKIYKYFYPIKYEEYVYKYAEEYDVDPLIIFSIIKAESGFDSQIVSKKGAIGLMQLMETTAEEIAEDLEVEYKKGETLYNPEMNIKLGVNYYAQLLKIYDNDNSLALAAYNAGIGNVDNWIKNEVIQDDGSDIENIPFNETNNYVRKTLRNYEIYKDLYK